MNSIRLLEAQSRHHSAHSPLHFRRQRASRTRLPLRANQLNLPHPAYPVRPLIQPVRSPACAASVSSPYPATQAEKTEFISTLYALISPRFAGVLGLRPLAPLPVRTGANQSNPADLRGFARPFVLPAAVPSARPWRRRISGVTSRAHLSKAAGINSSPVCGFTIGEDLSEPSSRSCVMQESDFPGGNHFGPFLLRKNRPFSACQARFESKP